jgi:hypothetical protein
MRRRPLAKPCLCLTRTTGRAVLQGDIMARRFIMVIAVVLASSASARAQDQANGTRMFEDWYLSLFAGAEFAGGDVQVSGASVSADLDIEPGVIGGVGCKLDDRTTLTVGYRMVGLTDAELEGYDVEFDPNHAVELGLRFDF